MTKIKAFFTHKNTVRKLTANDTQQTANYLETIQAFSRVTYDSIYVIDYEKQGFEYVSDNPLFLSGYTSSEVQEMGYEFYAKTVPEEDLNLLLKINTIGFDFLDAIPIAHRKAYTIAYDFHLLSSDGKPVLINQKLTPLFLTEEGKIWKAICIVSLSKYQQAGNITIYKNDGSETFNYDLARDIWDKQDKIILSNREKEILQYAIRGYSVNEMAEKLYISPNTIKFHRKKLFDKLEVNNISEAISYVTVNALI